MTLTDSKQANPNDASISANPATVTNITGISKVHLTMPIELKNSDISGFITRQLTIIPTAVESITAGINESAVCRIS